MSRRASHEAPDGAAVLRLELLGHMEHKLGVLEDLASVVGMIFHAGGDQGELTPRQCLAGLRIANQIEDALTEAHKLYAAIREAWPASDRGGAS